MSKLSEFTSPAEVFLAESAEDWIGVHVLGPPEASGQIPVRVTWTGEIPGYQVGDTMQVPPDTLARERLSVHAIAAQARKIHEHRQRLWDDTRGPAEAALATLRKLADRFTARATYEDMDRMVGEFRHLDRLLRTGHPLPREWEKRRDAYDPAVPMSPNLSREVAWVDQLGTHISATPPRRATAPSPSLDDLAAEQEVGPLTDAQQLRGKRVDGFATFDEGLRAARGGT
jgi:hypothetical protein